jgi:hypothetical protein
MVAFMMNPSLAVDLAARSNHKLSLKLAAQLAINVARRERDTQKTKNHEYRDQ